MASTQPIAGAPASAVSPLADLYAFKWSEFSFRLPLISASAVALCLFVGVALGHPGAALVAGGGALTIGFGPNQRICDSRLIPMLFGLFAISTATFAGTVVGHKGYQIVLASVVSAAIYGVLTIRNAGLAWVGQQASVALFVASAFPSGLRGGLARAGLILAGGLVQTVVTSLGLHLFKELEHDLAATPRTLYDCLGDRRRDLLHQLPEFLPETERRAAFVYAARLMLTVALATECYRRLGIQSGYWMPMTALLVQKPAFTETVSRGLMRVAGTLAGATLTSLLVAYVPLDHWTLAALTTFFAFWAFATNPVNYGLFTLSITSYIVFLLSLNQLPGPEIAHRRALCTIAGAAIALMIHLDALRRHRRKTAAATATA